MHKTRTVFLIAYCVLAVIIIACSPYERRVVPFQDPQASPNAIYFDGAVIAARGYVKSGEAKTPSALTSGERYPAGAGCFRQ